jgi:hypothetical protein
MHACPSCGAPLDDEGICTSCGALARGFFRGLDLGAPQIAQAVARGLDFYRLLGVEPDVDTRTIARRYRCACCSPTTHRAWKMSRPASWICLSWPAAP